MNEKNLHLIDYLLALIPVFIFIFPIAFFITALSGLYNFETVLLPLFINLGIGILIFASIIWTWKILRKPTPIVRSIILGLIFGFADFMVLYFTLWQLALLEDVTGTYQVIWEIFMGFISIVLITILADLHKLTDVYLCSMEWIQSKVY